MELYFPFIPSRGLNLLLEEQLQMEMEMSPLLGLCIFLMLLSSFGHTKLLSLEGFGSCFCRVSAKILSISCSLTLMQ